MIPDLPPELLLHIVDLIAAANQSSSLHQLCLTSKLLLPSARAALYRYQVAVTFRDTNVGATSSMAQSIYAEDEDEDERITRTSRGLETTLERNPLLAGQVQRITISLANVFSSAVVLPSDVLDRLLGICPNVTALHLRGTINQWEGEPLIATAQRRKPALDELEVFMTSESIAFLQSMPTLKRLSVSTVEDVWYQEAASDIPDDADITFPFALTSLVEVLGLPSLPQRILEPLIWSSSHSLCCLQLSCITFLDLGVHLPSLVALSHLHLTPFNSDINDDKSIRSLTLALSACNKLKALSFDNQSSHPLPVALLSELPVALRTISILGKVDIVGLECLLGNRSLSSLREVELGSGVGWPDRAAVRELAALHGWQPRLMQQRGVKISR